MNYSIKNDFLQLTASDFGAEMQSIKSCETQHEYLWQGDSNFWSGRSPLLFPIVGRLVDDKLKTPEGVFTIPKHGFARKSVFQVIFQSKNRILFLLNNNDETDEHFPYKFDLEVSYSLLKNSIIVNCTVRNNDEKKIYFSIGAHPAFNCGMGDVLEFEQNETAETFLMNSEGYLYQKEILLDNSNQLVIEPDTFKKDALMLEGLKSKSVTLKTNDSQIKVSFSDAPYFGLWSKPSAPFVCIEPWQGINDWVMADYEFQHKPGVIGLNVAETFDFSYSIEIKND